ncbi:MAG: LLM class F420-dependent oxidoreductase [Acidimicrobiales bacterium]
MKISMPLNYAGDIKSMAERVVEYENAGVDLVWVAEAYGMDAPTVMGYLAAITSKIEIASGILPIYSRTPTLLAMTAVGVDVLSEGRCVLGLGASGPQVIEGWHGVPYDAPIGRTREVVEICRKIWAREDKLVHDGKYYQLPLPEEQGTGLGKPLKIITHPPRPNIPILLASLGPKNVQMTAEVADGWLPTLFVPERASMVWGEDLERGYAKRDASLGTMDIMAGGSLAIGDMGEVTPLRDAARPGTALYVGGMGARGKNFYNSLFSRYGWEGEAKEIQDLYLEGHKDEAAAKIPADFLELSSLIGDESYVKDRLEAYAEAGVTYLNVTPVGPDPLGSVRKLRELIG